MTICNGLTQWAFDTLQMVLIPNRLIHNTEPIGLLNITNGIRTWAGLLDIILELGHLGWAWLGLLDIILELRHYKWYRTALISLIITLFKKFL